METRLRASDRMRMAAWENLSHGQIFTSQPYIVLIGMYRIQKKDLSVLKSDFPQRFRSSFTEIDISYYFVNS